MNKDKVEGLKKFKSMKKLKEAYPELTGKIILEAKGLAAKEVAAMPLPEFKVAFGKLYAAITADVAGGVDGAEAVLKAKAEAAREIADLSVGQFKKIFGKLYAAIAADVAGDVNAASLNVKGFLLDHEDPFADGAARAYAKAKKKETPCRLPFVLPFNDPDSRIAIASYIQRAGGAGDAERVKAATDALKKCK